MSRTNLQTVASVFSGVGQAGDFRWMIEQDEYADALFIFNDNEEQFLAFMQDHSSTFGCAAGGGNAVIRPYRCRKPPHAAGIPTGVAGSGYEGLAESAKTHIDSAMDHIRSLLAASEYRRVIYSGDRAGSLGTGIFSVGPDVKNYIVEQLESLCT